MRTIIILMIFIGASYIAKAQATNPAITEHNPAVRIKDSIIKIEIITPTRKAAAAGDPDWAALSKTITQKYDAVTADRTVTKAKIYFYYNKDWPQFFAGIIHYTDNWEPADDYKLLNLNAGMILKDSTDAAQLKEALKWAKAAADGDPANEQYKATCQAIQDKIKN